MKRTLYLGIDPSRYPEEVLHFPVIEIKEVSFSDEEEERAKQFFCAASDLILTSRQGVFLFFKRLERWDLPQEILHEKKIYVVGSATAELLASYEVQIASDSCQEGILALLNEEKLAGRTIFYPASSLARPFLREELEERGAQVFFFPFYEAKTREGAALPSLEGIEKVVFTSPSVVDAFFSLFSENSIAGKKIESIGPVTAKALSGRNL